MHGNEDAAYERLCEELEVAGIVNPLTVDEEWYDKLVQFIFRKMIIGIGNDQTKQEAEDDVIDELDTDDLIRIRDWFRVSMAKAPRLLDEEDEALFKRIVKAIEADDA